jgi:hypothetical protein
VKTERTIPDIIIRDNEKGTCMLIHLAVLTDCNVIVKESGKVLKYKYVPSHFLKIYFNIILPPMPRSSTWSRSFRSPHKLSCPPYVPHAQPISFSLMMMMMTTMMINILAYKCNRKTNLVISTRHSSFINVGLITPF